jgi:hypothetical protein
MTIVVNIAFDPESPEELAKAQKVLDLHRGALGEAVEPVSVGGTVEEQNEHYFNDVWGRVGERHRELFALTADGQWFTMQSLGERLGCSTESARGRFNNLGRSGTNAMTSAPGAQFDIYEYEKRDGVWHFRMRESYCKLVLAAVEDLTIRRATR